MIFIHRHFFFPSFTRVFYNIIYVKCINTVFYIQRTNNNKLIMDNWLQKYIFYIPTLPGQKPLNFGSTRERKKKCHHRPLGYLTKKKKNSS